MSPKYKNQNQVHIKGVGIMAFCILTLFLCICIIGIIYINTNNNPNYTVNDETKFSSVKSIVEYYGCKYKKEKTSSKDGFLVDIYLEFKYELYNNEESNEKFYNNIIEDIAYFLDYNSFRLIDTSKNEKIEIEVFGKKERIDKIIINGIEDYFIYMDSQISLKKYKEIKISDISINSEELSNCIQNNWDANSDFGTRESIFQSYNIYFDEGIKVRSVGNMIYNVVFTEKYEKEVVNSFTVGTKSDIIVSRMGTPTFKNDDGSIIGYKSDDVYVFFENNQISIYRNIAEKGFDKFFILVDKFLNNEYSLREFMNELTYLWPDYEEYMYGEETVFLSYPNKGIDIKINYENMDGIILYNNIGISPEIANSYLEHTEFVGQLQVDNVFNAEKRRVDKERNWDKNCKEYKENYEKDDSRNRGTIYDYYMKMDSNDRIMNVYFISNDLQFFNCELNDFIDTYIWINEYCFVYSNSKKGIYYYDLKNQKRGQILQGDEEFKINSYENGILKYDNKELPLVY